jgi:hypothetical protein
MSTEAGRRLHKIDHGDPCPYEAKGLCALVNDGPWGPAAIPAIEAEAEKEARIDEASRCVIHEAEARATVLRELREEVAGMDTMLGTGTVPVMWLIRAAVLAAIARRIGDG